MRSSQYNIPSILEEIRTPITPYIDEDVRSSFQIEFSGYKNFVWKYSQVNSKAQASELFDTLLKYLVQRSSSCMPRGLIWMRESYLNCEKNPKKQKILRDELNSIFSFYESLLQALNSRFWLDWHDEIENYYKRKREIIGLEIDFYHNPDMPLLVGGVQITVGSILQDQDLREWGGTFVQHAYQIMNHFIGKKISIQDKKKWISDIQKSLDCIPSFMPNSILQKTWISSKNKIWFSVRDITTWRENSIEEIHYSLFLKTDIPQDIFKLFHPEYEFDSQKGQFEIASLQELMIYIDFISNWKDFWNEYLRLRNALWEKKLIEYSNGETESFLWLYDLLTSNNTDFFSHYSILQFLEKYQDTILRAISELHAFWIQSIDNIARFIKYSLENGSRLESKQDILIGILENLQKIAKILRFPMSVSYEKNGKIENFQEYYEEIERSIVWFLGDWQEVRDFLSFFESLRDKIKWGSWNWICFLQAVWNNWNSISITYHTLYKQKWSQGNRWPAVLQSTCDIQTWTFHEGNTSVELVLDKTSGVNSSMDVFLPNWNRFHWKNSLVISKINGENPINSSTDEIRQVRESISEKLQYTFLPDWVEEEWKI